MPGKALAGCFLKERKNKIFPIIYIKIYTKVGRVEFIHTSSKADHPDIQKLLVRKTLLEVLLSVISTTRAARVVLLLQQRQSALLLHSPKLSQGFW